MLSFLQKESKKLRSVFSIQGATQVQTYVFLPLDKESIVVLLSVVFSPEIYISPQYSVIHNTLKFHFIKVIFKDVFLHL